MIGARIFTALIVLPEPIVLFRGQVWAEPTKKQIANAFAFIAFPRLNSIDVRLERSQYSAISIQKCADAIVGYLLKRNQLF
jgi:hypothetical protein